MLDAFAPLFPFFATALGLALGSFYTVCVHRYLSGQSINNPRRSCCPHCGHTLAWFENIPVLSYVLLLGRCRHCKTRIHPRYLVMELVSGALALALALKFGPSWAWLGLMAVAGVLIVASFIDFDSYILPDVLTLPGAALAFVVAVFALDLSWLDSLIGAASGAGVFWLLLMGYQKLRGFEGMGLGDVKLMLLIGALSGWQLLPFAILSGSLAALGGSLFYLRSKDADGMRTAVPFGPFLSLGAMLTVLVGREAMIWYMNIS